jgi:uncharacterized protein (DUF2236 family)
MTQFASTTAFTTGHRLAQDIRDISHDVVGDVGARLSSVAAAPVRRALGVPAPKERPHLTASTAFMPVGGVARRIHADLPAMLIGGLSALLMQTLHPLAMAGVADHSDYRSDPAGRLTRTAIFLGATTFGDRQEAFDAIRAVRRIHTHVNGNAPDGRFYSASDPELLRWVHAAQVNCFLESARRYGSFRPNGAASDQYLSETAAVAEALGATQVPRSRRGLDNYFSEIRSELRAGDQAREARDFLLRGAHVSLQGRIGHRMVALAALGVLPPWVRSMLGIPFAAQADPLVVRLATRASCDAVRILLGPPPQQQVDGPA